MNFGSERFFLTHILWNLRGGKNKPQKKQAVEETLHVTKAQCTTLEAKIHQVCRDVPAVLAIAMPEEKFEGLVFALKASHVEVQTIITKYE